MASTTVPPSYAQAAKGQSISTIESQEEPNSSGQIAETAEEQTIDLSEEPKQLGNVSESSKGSVPITAETKSSEEQTMVNGISMDRSEHIKPQSMKIEPPRAKAPSVSSSNATKSIQDDLTGHGDTESSWEKVSQNSQAEQVIDKPEGDMEGKKLSTYEHVKPQMKEAPVPVVNIWQKRMEDAQAKTVPRSNSLAVKPEQSFQHSNGDAGHKRPVSKSFTSNPQTTTTEEKSHQKPATSASTSASMPPPPTSDVSLWPTPNLAKSEEKKTGNDRPDQPEKPVTKIHGKEKWEKVAFVPTAVFNTPIPTRGGARGGRISSRGGREGISRGASVSSSTGPTGERSNNNTNVDNQSSGNQIADRPKPRDASTTRGGGVPKPKRSSSAGAMISREPGHFSDSYDKHNNFGQRFGNGQHQIDGRRVSASTQPDGNNSSGQAGGLDVQKRASTSFESNGEPRFNRPDRNFQPRLREPSSEQNGYVTRGEGRSERGGRGGWRGKSGTPGHTSFSTASHYQQPFTNSKPHAEQRHNSHPAPFPNAREPRHSRTNSRSQSIPNGQPFNRFGVNVVGPNNLPMLQTDIANALPYSQQPAIMSAVPFLPSFEHVQLPAMVQMQLEYYFSVDNLCKDIFLRKNMDSQGFVFLHILAKFNRIQTLTTDNNLLKWVCGRSGNIELRTGQDGLDRVRKADDWQQWVLPSEERDPSAQNDGPTQLLSPRFEGFPPVWGNLEGGPNMLPNATISPAHPFMMNGFHGEPLSADVNGHRGHFNQHSNIQTPLSADVPDFKPAQPGATQNTRFQDAIDAESKFPNVALESLKVLIRSSENDLPSKRVTSSNTLANGDSGHVEDAGNGEPKVNGSSTDEHHVNGTAQHSEE